ncbi:MAG TPA: hypothetical protein V6C86_20195 [Oculatellaceae cyanobacterium]
MISVDIFVIRCVNLKIVYSSLSLLQNPTMMKVSLLPGSLKLLIPRNFKKLGFLALLCVSICGGSVHAQVIQNDVLADLIKKKELAAPDQNVKATLSQNEAIITCDRHATDDDSMCKLRAILIAKCVFDSQPNEIQKSKIQFLDLKKNSVSTATIKRSEIVLFGEGKLDKKELMSSIDYVTEGPSVSKDSSQVADGELQTQRMMLLRRIQKMKERGTNVTAFMTIFNEIEGLAKANSDKTKLEERIEYLSEKVSEQERMLHQATQRPALTSPPGSGGSTDVGSSFGESPKISAALASIDSKVAAQVRSIRNLLLGMQSLPDPRPKQALKTLDDAIMTKDIRQISSAGQQVIQTLQPNSSR